MKNNITIPKYLFDELIEYFDNKSDADNGTPNKEMQILSQLQEWKIGNSKFLEIYDLVSGLSFNGFLSDRITCEEAEKRIINFIDGYSLRESSSNSTDELRKEVERLKGLLEREVKNKVSYITGYKSEDEAWQRFKDTHNL